LEIDRVRRLRLRRSDPPKADRVAARETVEEVFMKYKPAEEIERAGGAALAVPETRAERLLRWADTLDRMGGARLHTLWRTEHATRGSRASMRSDGSPLAVAFADPVLRVAGLKDDSYAEAKRFFQLTDYELHWIVCYCHFGETMSAEAAARQVRAMAIAGPPISLGRWLARLFVGRPA
jgi:hypothetical protein